MKRKFAAILMALLIVGGSSIPAYAVPEQDPASRIEEMRTRYEEMEERFDSLTDAQKAQVYEQNAKVLEQIKQLMQMYVDLGVFSKEEADLMLGHLEAWNTRAQQEGRIVGIPGLHGRDCSRKAPER
jgi:parvulin-like peptidyl-prolyl isomerase